MEKIILLILALSAPASVFADISKGSRFIDNSNYVGTVKEVFSNGKASVSYDGSFGTYIKSIDELGEGVESFRGFSMGSRFVDSSWNVGTIKEVFNNGKASVSYDGSSGTYIKSIDELSIRVESYAGISAKSRFVDDSNNIGTINEVFSNGVAAVSFDGSSGTYVVKLSGLRKK